MTTEIEWIREGSPAVEYRTNYSGPDRADRATITKITKTQIVLDNGERYRRSDLRKVGEGHSYAGHTTLVPVTDPRIRDVNAETMLRRLVVALEKIPRDAYGKGEAEVLAVMDRMEQTVRAARQSITRKEG